MAQVLSHGMRALPVDNSFFYLNREYTPAFVTASTRAAHSTERPDIRQVLGRSFSPSLANAQPRCSSNRMATEACNAAASYQAHCPPGSKELAHALADKAGDVIRPYFRVPLDTEIKSDQSPVTVADKNTEAALREMIAARFPDHGILGEEEGSVSLSGNEEYVWVLDPIDGTASFITGKPLFGVLIALLHRGVPVLGIIDQPILRERWVGVVGEKSTMNGSPVSARACDNLAAAYLYSTSPHLFSNEDEKAFHRLREKVRRTNYGCDCYAFGLLSLGFVDVVVEYGMKPWDYAALIPVVEGAGGVITDWCGNPLTIDIGSPEKWAGDILAAGDSRVHAEALKALAWNKSEG